MRRLESHVPLDLGCRLLVAGDVSIALLSFSPVRRARLTEAERHVALLVARGLSNAAIATVRCASQRTVANQVAAMLKKLGVSSRTELTARLDAWDFV